jgi:hypothetical protein
VFFNRFSEADELYDEQIEPGPIAGFFRRYGRFLSRTALIALTAITISCPPPYEDRVGPGDTQPDIPASRELSTASTTLKRDGYISIAWEPNNPSDDVDKYKIYFIEQSRLSDISARSTSLAGWNYIEVPAGRTELNITGLEAGKIYHVRATAVNRSGAESWPSENQPIGAAHLYGNCQTSISPENRVDGNDLKRWAAAKGTKVGDPKWDSLPDFDGNGSVDTGDYSMLMSNWGKTQLNEMGTRYVDERFMFD